MASNSSLSKTTQSLLEHQIVSFLDNFKTYSSTTRFKTWLIVNNQGQWKGHIMKKGHGEIHDDFWVTLFFFSFKQMSLSILSWSNITLNTSHLLFFKSKQFNHFIFRRLSVTLFFFYFWIQIPCVLLEQKSNFCLSPLFSSKSISIKPFIFHVSLCLVVSILVVCTNTRNSIRYARNQSVLVTLSSQSLSLKMLYKCILISLTVPKNDYFKTCWIHPYQSTLFQAFLILSS